MSSASRRIVGKTSLVKVMSCEPLHGTLEGIDRSLPWSKYRVVADLSHPAFCSARDLTACAAMLGGHAVDVVEGLTVRMPRVHVELLESVRSATISEVASSFASLQVAEDGGFGVRLTANRSASRPCSEALNRSRSAPLVVVDHGPGADEQAVGKTGWPDVARIFEAWYDERDLRNRSWEQVVGSSFACPFEDHPDCKFDHSDISVVERLSSRFEKEFVKEKELEPGDKVYGELCLWVRACELAGCYDHLNLGGNACLEHVARVIQSFVDALRVFASVDWSNQKFFVTRRLRRGQHAMASCPSREGGT